MTVEGLSPTGYCFKWSVSHLEMSYSQCSGGHSLIGHQKWSNRHTDYSWNRLQLVDGYWLVTVTGCGVITWSGLAPMIAQAFQYPTSKITQRWVHSHHIYINSKAYTYTRWPPAVNNPPTGHYNIMIIYQNRNKMSDRVFRSSNQRAAQLNGKQRAYVPRWSAIMTIHTQASRPCDCINSGSGEVTQLSYRLCNFMDWTMFNWAGLVLLCGLHINKGTLW